MRKIAKYLFSSLILICAIIFGAGLNLNESVYAQEETNFVPSYFSVKKTDNTLVSDGGTAFISGGDTLLVSLNLNGTALISDITPYILLNDLPLSNVDIEKMANVNGDNETEYAIKENENGEGSYYFIFNISGQKIFNNTRSDGTSLYGKLDFTFDYHESVDGSIVNRSFNFSFYLLKSDDYNLAKYKIDNAYASGSAVGYNNDYVYEFESAQLPTLTYDARFFDLFITKTALGEETKYLNINYRGENLNLGSDVVYVSNESSIVTVVFNDLATYTIKYNYIHLYNDNATVLLDRTASSQLTASDRLAVTGFTLNYTEEDDRKEFKNISSKGQILNERTDFTYLYNNNLSGDLAVADLLSKVNNYLTTKNISLPTTNQVPLQIGFNKQIDFQNSYIQKLVSNEGILSLSGEKILLENEFITYEGKYLLKVQAKDGTCQFFVFEKHSSVPSFVTMSYDRVLNKEIEELSTGEYTNEKVIVKYTFTPSIFDTKTKLVVQQFDYDRVSLIRETVISTNELSNVFSENGYYVVALYYGNKQSPTATASFIIDNMEINDYSVFNVVSLGNNKYAKTNEVDFLTNAPIALFWNDKLSGATVTCDYKYFKLESIEEDYLDYFNTSDYLKNFYSQHNNYSIPTLNYINADLSTTTTPYIKPSNSSYISSVSVFDTTSAGIYVFRLKDDCGQEKYFCIVIDNTAPVVLQANVDGNFVKVEDINTVSNDTTVYWGKQKIIKMQNFDLNSDSEWIKPLREKHSSYFARYTLVNSTDYYFEVNVNSDVYRSIGGQNAVLIPQADIKEYGTTIKFLDKNSKANEQQYIFYFRDESNDLFGSTNEETYTRYASNVYSVKVTSDASRLELYYKKADKNNSLILSSYNKEGLDNEGYSLKNQYYQPTNKLTFSSDKVLYLDFLSKPNKDVIEIDSVVVEYYPFTRKNVSSFYYSEFDNTPETIIVYNHDEDGVIVNDLTSFNSLTGKQEWKVNTYYNNQHKKEMTKEGKYVVKRAYKILDETLNTTNKNYDYITREFTFYVDTNSIINSPEVVEGEKVQSIVGGGIKVKITNSYFTETYLAQNYSNRSKNANSTHEGSVYEIFKTNKLPVKIMIPYYKYGYETEAGNSFEASNPMYFDENDKVNSLINYNTLNVAIYKYQRLNDVETGNYDELVYQNSKPTINNGYISLPELANGGYYEVVISELDPTAPQYVFLFHISEEAPQFTLGSDKNIEFQSLNLESGTQYYTNSTNFRVSWQHSVNPYMAKIARNGISFYASYNDGSTSSVISVSELEIKQGATERDFYVDIDLTKYPQINVREIYSIFVTARFETIEENGEGYFVGNYQTTKEVVIDTTAPYESISALLENSGLKQFETLIRVNEEYNTVTNTEGLFRNFAFSVDKAFVSELIKINKTTGLHAYNVWYRSVEKYNASHSDETDPNGFVASSTYKVLDYNEFTSMYNNHYYEIIESDLAGNIAVYTIYLTDYAKEQKDKTLISWSTPVKENEEQTILVKDYSNEIEIYSKKSFNINKITLFKSSSNDGYPWYNITIKGTTYFHSPYLAVNQLITYGGDLFNIEDVTKLDVRDEMQKIVISNQPYFNETSIHVGVISESRTLSYLHLSEISLNKDEDGNYNFVDLNGNTVKAKEGLLVEIPQGANRANIYATQVTVIYNDTKQLSINVPLDSEKALSEIVGAENIRIIGYRSGSKLYAVIYIVRPIDNTYYVYQVTDNFGQIYPPKTYIFGAEAANENFISDVPLASRIDGNDEWYYSTKSISFEFNREKNYVVFKSLNINGVVKDINTKHASAKAELYTCGIILENISSVVYKVTVLSHQETSSSGIIGGKRVVQFIIYNNITVQIDGFDNSGRNCTFVINNTTPEINLFGKNNENLNAILGNVGMIVGPPVTIKFVDTSNEEYPNIVYLQNRDLGTTEVISSGHIVAQPGNYSILIGYSSESIFAGVNYFKRINFKLSDEAVEFYAVYVNGSEQVSSPTGKPFEIQGIDASSKDVIYTHYIVNGPYEIYCNEGQKIEAIRQTQYNLPSTNVYKITNHNADAVGYNLNYYETLIAITIIEKTNSIIDKFAYIEPEGTSLTLYDKLEINSNTNKENHTVVIEKGSSYEAVATYSFNSYYAIKENTVTAIVTDENGAKLSPRTETIGETTYIYFDMSGYYRVKFVDLAGNKQLFNITDNFEITYLSSVIFNVNDSRPVNNAIFDSSKPVTISIPTSSRSLYDNRIVPTIHVERNGEPFTPDASSNSTVYTFTKSGLYKIWFSAVVGGKPVREEAYYFTIINSSESRWAFEFQEYASYYIDKIVRDGIDILPSLLSNPTIGTHINIEDENGEVITRLKNVLISLYDEQTGAGRYYLEIKTNDTNNQTFGFSFWINNVEPPISISLKEGETTTGDIIVRFSKTNLYNEAGECILRINGYKDLVINAETIKQAQADNTDIVNLKITEANTYYIQLYSESDKLLYSYCVTKKAPLNAISIIIIIVVTLGVGGLTTMFILLRKKMKIR